MKSSDSNWTMARLAILALWALLGAASGANAAEAKRPNILFIFSDDHAYQAISAYGSKLLQTPNMDRLANEGMRFDRCLVPNSICGPSRATIPTGNYSHANGLYNHTNSRFAASPTTFPKLLQKSGYQTAIVGKWHLISNPTGFDYWEILPGQGQYYNPPMIRGGDRVKYEGYTTDILTDLTLDWLKNKRDPSKPFLMMCQHKAPHREWEPNLKYLGHDGDRNYPEPETLFDDYSGRGKAEHAQDMTIEKTMTPRDVKLTPPPALTPEQRKAWDAYYEPRNEAFRKANLQGKDRPVEPNVTGTTSAATKPWKAWTFADCLKETGLDKDTIVVYSSDQGFYLGEHGWFDNGGLANRCAAAVHPLARWRSPAV